MNFVNLGINYIVSVNETFSAKLFESLSFSSSGKMTNNEIQKHATKDRNEEFRRITEFPQVEVNKLVNDATRVCARKYTELSKAQSIPLKKIFVKK